MGNIKASDVNKLRQTTGAGMMDCKNALVDAEGDFEKAIEVLRKKGQKVAAKRADRESSEGVVIALVNQENSKGVIVSLNCETDFVAKNETFIALAENIVQKALNVNNKEDLLSSSYQDGMSISEKMIEQTGVIGEKIEVGRFEVLEAPFVNAYIHAGNKIASLAGISANISGGDQVAKNIAMQVAAMSPIALDKDQVDKNIIEKEIEIAKEQLRQEGKPEAMLEKIAQGKLSRFMKDNTLVNQSYIKESKQSVADYVKSVDNSLKVVGYKRVSI